MIIPAGFGGAVFGTAEEGDGRTDTVSRDVFAQLGTPSEWAYVSQVHGRTTVEALRGGPCGEADALVVTRPGLAVTVATADCVPVVIAGEGFAAVVHAGWRGAAAGVVESCLDHVEGLGLTPQRAAIGPSICSRCYEVGAEVLERFPEYAATTSWGTPSIDLAGVVASRLGELGVWRSEVCTRTDERLHSYRANRTVRRQVTVAWIPEG